MTEPTPDARERILRATAKLLASGGREAVSTRTVSAAAGVQAPTIYRQFGDMGGLLDAVGRETFAGYLRQMTVSEHQSDPIEELRRGWDQHVDFGLSNPAVYALIYGDPVAAANAPAAHDAEVVLHELVARVAQAGRLQVSVSHAVRLLAAAGSGVTLSLIALAPGARDPKLSEAMREAVLAAITIAPVSGDALNAAPGPKRIAACAVALRAVLDDVPSVLSHAERQLLSEWLDLLAGADGNRAFEGQAATSHGQR